MAERPDIAVLTPYARSMGVTLDRWDDDVPILRVDFSEAVLGRPGALHGGAISGLLETAGYGVLRVRLAADGREATLKPINVTVQFLRSGREKPSFAAGRITKLGRRTANISVEAWQDERGKPIATAIMNVKLAERA